MQLKELEYLLKTVECGSITKAAEQMFISQPTLTKNIQSSVEMQNPLLVFMLHLNVLTLPMIFF